MPNRAAPLILAFAAALVVSAARPATAAPDACGVTAPRFEPKPHRRGGPETAGFPGGAHVSRPLATPCRRVRREIEV